MKLIWFISIAGCFLLPVFLINPIEVQGTTAIGSGLNFAGLFYDDTNLQQNLNDSLYLEEASVKLKEIEEQLKLWRSTLTENAGNATASQAVVKKVAIEKKHLELMLQKLEEIKGKSENNGEVIRLQQCLPLKMRTTVLLSEIQTITDKYELFEGDAAQPLITSAISKKEARDAAIAASIETNQEGEALATDVTPDIEAIKKTQMEGSWSVDDILFGFDSYAILEASLPSLDQVVRLAAAYPKMKIQIEGHTDSKGSDLYNQHLSERRAKSVASYLGAKGITKDRMTVTGYGESRPIAPNNFPDGRDNPKGRKLNRRTTVLLK